jgi:hypothetical protein
MLVGSILIVCIRLVRPDLLQTGDSQQGIPPLTLRRALKLGTPVAFFHVTSMIAGNSAYLYLNVSFIQMIKAWTSGCVYLVGCLMGTQLWSTPVAKTIAAITLGLSIASYGELEFDLYGFCLQVLSITLEGLRINLLEISLKSNGYKLNPLSSLQIFAPIMLGILIPCVVVWDRDALSWAAVNQVGLGFFSANALCAFFLNMSVYLVIQTASGLIFTLGGVLKDLLIIFGSAIIMSTAITGTQVFGYLIALGGLQAYGVVSKETAAFERIGVIPGLWERLHSRLSRAKDEDLEPKLEPKSPSIAQRAMSGLSGASPVAQETELELMIGAGDDGNSRTDPEGRSA